jgi:RNase adaptor protein for sRNA GlmZ degradation
LSTREDAGPDKVAIVVDVREEASGAVSRWPEAEGPARRQPDAHLPEASHSALVRRFSETRRPYPLAPDRSVSEARGALNAIRSMAD